METALGDARPSVAHILEDLAKCSGKIGKNDEAKMYGKRARDVMSAFEANAYALSEVDQPPRIIRKIDPLYPFAAKRKNIQGKVTLRFIVTKEGRVVEPSVVKGDPPDVFDNSALKAILRWRFKPAIKDGKAVDVIIIAPLKFELIK
jgi:TonB family protein